MMVHPKYGFELCCGCFLYSSPLGGCTADDCRFNGRITRSQRKRRKKKYGSELDNYSLLVRDLFWDGKTNNQISEVLKNAGCGACSPYTVRVWLSKHKLSRLDPLYLEHRKQIELEKHHEELQRKKAERQARNIRIREERWSEYERQYGWRALYDEGLTDEEIAVRSGSNRSMIVRWRQARHLEPNGYSAEVHYPEALRKQDYRDGLTDKELALKWNLAPSTVVRWRQTRHLPPNE